MNRLMVTNRNGVVPDLSPYFDVVSAGNPAEVDALVLWNDAVGENRVIAEEAHRLGKPVFVVQHGFYTSKDTEYAENGTLPLGSWHFLWSEYHSKLFQRDGVSADKIIITGSTLYPYLRPYASDGETVVFAPTHLGPNEPNEKNAAEAFSVWGRLGYVSGIRPVAKLVAGEHTAKHFPGNVVASSLLSLNHVPVIVKLLKTAACVVVQDESTFAFLAYAMDVPVVKIANHYPAFSDACTLSTVEDLPEAVRLAVANPDLKRAERLAVIKKMGGDPKTVVPISAIVGEISSRLESAVCA